MALVALRQGHGNIDHAGELLKKVFSASRRISESAVDAQGRVVETPEPRHLPRRPDQAKVAILIALADIYGFRDVD
jgi:hypothetical protein